MNLIIPVESIFQNKGGVILYNPYKNKIIDYYIHDRKWRRVGWRGGILYNDYLIATDWNELHYFNIKKWKYEYTFRKKSFNDLHYVQVNKNKLFVVNTGIDAIEIFNNPMEPKFERIEFVFKLNKMFKDRYIDLNRKYNKMYKIKPHSCHPNCISFNEHGTYITCFQRQQKINTGQLIDMKSGKKLFHRNMDCHDGLFYKNDFYLTKTRQSKILKFKNLRPVKNNIPDEIIDIGHKGWWRGMVIHNDIIFIFCSRGYSNKKSKAIMAMIDLQTQHTTFKKLPVCGDIHWDTIYQPNVFEG